MALTQKHERYPNGQPYISLWLEGSMLGHVVAVEDGYLPQGMRKVRPTIQQAAAALVKSSIEGLKGRLAEEQRWLADLEAKE